MGLVVATVFINDRPFDTFEAPEQSFALSDRDSDFPTSGLRLSMPEVAHNWAYYDTVRGEVWARVYVSGDRPWATVHNLSERSRSPDGDHRWLSARWPGSLCNPYRQYLPTWMDYSVRVLAREYLLHQKFKELA